MPRRPALQSLPPVALALLAGTIGCADLLGFDAYDTSSGAGGGTSTGGSSTGGTPSTGGSTSSGGGSTSTGGTTTSSGGSTSTGTLTDCTAGLTEPCYDGPPGSDGIGLCKPGERTCDGDGQWGACLGAVLPTPESCATVDVDESCDNLAACNGTFRWARHLGAAQPQTSNDVAVGSDGSVVLVGAAQGALDVGGGPLTAKGADDILVVKLDAEGKHLWSKRFGNAMNQSALAVALTPAVPGGDPGGDVVVVGRNVGQLDLGDGPLVGAGLKDAFVLKLAAADGATQWSKLFSSPANETATAVAVDKAGDVLVAGIYAADLTLGGPALPTAANDSLFVAKLAGGDGAHLWSHGYPAANPQTVPALAVDGAGAAVVASHGVGPVDLGGGAIAPFNGVLSDVFLVKLDGGGAYQWSHAYGGQGADEVSDVAIGPDGGAVLVGQSSGSYSFGIGPVVGNSGGTDLTLWKVGPGGGTLWWKYNGDAANQNGLGVTVDHQNDVILAAQFAGTLDLGGPLTATTPSDHAFVRLASDGSPRWARAIPNAKLATTRLATDPLGNIVFATAINGTVDFGGGPFTTSEAGDLDIAVGKLAP